MPRHDIANDATQFSKCNAEADSLRNLSGNIFAFRRYWVVPHARQLVRGTQIIRLGGRAFDLLIVLLQARGHIVSKNEIMSRVWPSMTVEECNLRFQMTVLRKALGEDRDVIKTIPGRGYLFAAANDQGAFAMEPAISSRGAETLSPRSAPFGRSGWIVPDPRLVPSGTSSRSQPALIAGLEEATGMTSTSPCSHEDLASRLQDAVASELGPGATARKIHELEAEIIHLKHVISALALGQL
jgi:DNA-binding winged helix-turn-helix (wHTH) protein